MKFNIKYKLFLLTTIPIFAILPFSANHVLDKYEMLSSHEILLDNSKIIKSSSNLLHELQVERGVGSSYINSENYNLSYFQNKLQKQKNLTDEKIKKFQDNLKSINNTKIHIDHIKNIQTKLNQLHSMREKIIDKTISAKSSFEYYTNLNKLILQFAHSIKIHSNESKEYNNILALKKLLTLQELAGQERAIISNINKYDDKIQENINQFQNLLSKQKEHYSSINSLLLDLKLKDKLSEIHKRYMSSYIYTIRKNIEDYEYKQLLKQKIFKLIGYGGLVHNIDEYNKSKNIKFFNDFLNNKDKFNKIIKKYISHTDNTSKEKQIILALAKTFNDVSITNVNNFNMMQALTLYRQLEEIKVSVDIITWFELSTKRIDDIHNFEATIYKTIVDNIKADKIDLQHSISSQIILTLSIVILLILAAFFTSRNITNSINELNVGIKEFFNYLNFNTKDAKPIKIDSNDEINEIAQEINSQIKHIQVNLVQDEFFIKETTEVVSLMKEGDFSEKVYFDPHNPNLEELKKVFNELVKLISQKIDDQTKSLERLNSSLEDKVYKQTLELQNKLQEITIARDKAVQAEIAKDEFLANMSHEIRTPLNAILGFVTLLKKRIENEKSLSYLNIIDSSGKSLLTIINDILDFSKIQSGKFAISKYPVDPVEEFSNAVLLFASKAYEKHLIYAVYIDPNLPKTITIDSVRVKQVLSNLLSNAIKFTPEDGEIKVKIIYKDKRLIISVQDSGIGISHDNQSKIFSAFEQADGSTTRKYGGTGLGLSISAKLASLMDGTLTLKSDEKIGSTFILNIPVDEANMTKREHFQLDKLQNLRFATLGTCHRCSIYTKLIKKYLNDFGIENILELNEYQKDGYDILFFAPDDDYNIDIINSKTPAVAMLRSVTIRLANLPNMEPLYAPFVPKSIIEAINNLELNDLHVSIDSVNIQPSEDTPIYNGKILVAEDNKTNQMLIGLILDEYGLKYKIANNGVEAVDMFKKEKFDLVLMDENMPELNGIGAMKQIKEYEQKNSLTYTPVIALTASVLETDRERFLNEGMDGFVGKPINNKDLEAEFNKYLLIK